MTKNALSAQQSLSGGQGIDGGPAAAGKDQSGLKERRARGRPKANAQAIKRSTTVKEGQLDDPASKWTAAQ